MTETNARDLFRAAYDNRYTWDGNFPGYTADVTYTAGDHTYSAKAKINADYTFDVSGIDDEDAKKAIQGQVWEIAVHRVRRPFEETHGKNEFTLGETDETGATEIFVKGKAMGDRYKVKNNEVSLVHRHIHGVVVTINTFSSHNTGSGYLSHEYDSVYTDPQTGESKGGKSHFTDTYENIGGYFILTRRVIRTEHNGQEHVQDFGFANVALLTPAAVGV